MARKKTPPKPIFAVKHDFYESLDNFCHQAMMLHQTMQSLVQLNVIPEGHKLRPIVDERLKAFEVAMMSDGDANREE